MAARKKTAARRKTAKKTKTTRKSTTKKKSTATKRVTAIKEAYTKSQLVRALAEKTGQARTQANTFLEALGEIIQGHIGPKAAVGNITIPGLMKITRVYKPAKRARKGINPFTGEETVFKAKPAHYVIKIRALKKLKDMVS